MSEQSITPSTECIDGFHTVPDGLKLHFRDHATATPDARAPVICLHGLTRNLADFDELAPRIAATGRRVVTVSMRGRGRSDRDPKSERYTPPVYASDVLSLLDALDIPRAVFVGTSLGGIVSMIVAMADVRRLAGCVLNDMGGALAEEGLSRIKGYVGGENATASDWAEAAARTREVNAVAFPDRDDAFWEAFARRTWIETSEGIAPDYDPAIAINVQREGGDPNALWTAFDALKDVSTLLVRGALSDLIAPDTVEAMRARKPDLSVVEVPGVGHAPLLTEPEAWSAIAGFLDRVG